MLAVVCRSSKTNIQAWASKTHPVCLLDWHFSADQPRPIDKACHSGAPYFFRQSGERILAHIIVVGNEKGGSGKSTTSMHVSIALARMGYRVGAVDLDLRQRSFGRYIENRNAFAEKQGITLPTPDYRNLPEVDNTQLDNGINASDHRLSTVMAALEGTSDFILIDCPGSHTRLSQIAHSLADTLITPLNDSFVDFDLLARTDPTTGRVLGPSIYSEMVWGARQMRAQAGLKPIDWIVLRNRLGAQQMHNKKKVGKALEELSKRIGFRVSPGFSERVIFRELFPRGLTLLDLKDIGVEHLNMSNIAARQELRDLMATLKLPGVTVSV
jgi:chromosome partitioning protein